MMANECFMQDKDGRYIPAIPEPFWEKSWRTFFRWRPLCCRTMFKSREAYDQHYVLEHMEAVNDGE